MRVAILICKNSRDGRTTELVVGVQISRLSKFNRQNQNIFYSLKKRKMAGEWIFLTPEYILQDMPVDFFDFQFIMNADGSMKECKFNWEVLDPAIWSSLFVIREKYLNKSERLKKRTKIFEKKQKSYAEQQEARAKGRDHLQEHIRKSEAKLSEYKNVILAFWKLASCNPISK